MKTATISEDAGIAAQKTFRKLIDLGNGVMFPVDSEEEAGFVEWMIEEAKAGRATLPKNAPGPIEKPSWLDTDPKMSTEEFWAFIEDERKNRF